jgi:hypothetical protein
MIDGRLEFCYGPETLESLLGKSTAGLISTPLFALKRLTEAGKEAFDVLTCSDLGGLHPWTRDFHPFRKRLDDSKVVIWQQCSWNRLNARGAKIRICVVRVNLFRILIEHCTLILK